MHGETLQFDCLECENMCRKHLPKGSGHLSAKRHVTRVHVVICSLRSQGSLWIERLGVEMHFASPLCAHQRPNEMI